jgi:tetratricopeptide (TPR) repeat protein
MAIATDNNIQIYDTDTRECVASFKAHTESNFSLAWTPDGTRLLTSGNNSDPTIREWDVLTWQQVGDPWTGHTGYISSLTVNPAGTLIASASDDHHIRLWRLSDRRTVATFKHSSSPECVTFSVDGKHILSGGEDKMISEWALPVPHPKILAIKAVRDACIDGDLSTAEQLLTQDISIDANYTSYAYRSFVMSRKHKWSHALQDAIKSISIQTSLIGYISKGIALCGKGHIRDARAAFDVAFMYTNQDPQIVHLLLLIKSIALFNADQHDEANLLLKELAGCPNVDTRACHIVEAYLRVQLGIKAMDGAHYDGAADYFTAALNSSAFSSASPIHSMYEDLVVLFGLDLKSFWLTAHQKRCDSFLWAGKLQDAVKSYQYIMVLSDENAKTDYLNWSNDFKRECSALCSVNGDAALAASEYDRAIDLYSAVIDLNSASDVVFAKRSEAMLGKMLWDDALLDAQKVTELNPSSHVGYQLSHKALCGAQCYDKAIKAFTIMLSKLSNAPEAQIRDLRRQYVHPSEAEDAVQKAVWIEFEYVPLRLLNTSTGLLCDRAAQLNAFKTSADYMELLSSITKHSDLRMKRIKDVVARYFRCVLLSHRWQDTEVLLHDIQEKVVYELYGFGGIEKLQSFCRIARDAGYLWAWMDTCCIDKRSNTELQESVNSMFIWYRHSALTIVYLCDVPPSSQSGALARSVWNERGWTFQEFVAPKVVIFYQKDWSLYLGDRSHNHKESPEIMKELEDATGIDARALISFRPGMSDARRRLQWASSRVTTLQEDIAYSLFGIFGVHLPVIYGEKKQNALGRLLQEIVARSGDITVLDWIGQPSEFNSCLPAHITSYTTPPRTLPSLSEDDIHTQVSSLRHTMPTNLALEFYDKLQRLTAPRFANCRLHLPCISFRVAEVRRRRGLAPVTYEIKADGLHDLLIATEDTLVQFSRAKPIRQTFLLVRPWDRYLLGVPDFAEQPDFADHTESIGDSTEHRSPTDDSQIDDSDKLPGGELVEEEPSSRALRLMVHLGHPFDAFLLAQQRVGEYKRIASDHNIVVQIKDIASVDNMDIGTIEIL